MDVVFKIVQGDEVQSVKIVRVGKAAKAFRPTSESFKAMVEAARVRVAEDDAKKKASEEYAIQQTWPNAIALENGLKYVVLQDGQRKPAVSGQKLTVSYSADASSAARPSSARRTKASRIGERRRRRSLSNWGNPRLIPELTRSWP